MPLEDLEAADLLRELEHFCLVGREAYLSENGILRRRAKAFFIKYRHQHCDMKAVVYMALGRNKPGYTRDVAERVGQLGFEVVELSEYDAGLVGTVL